MLRQHQAQIQKQIQQQNQQINTLIQNSTNTTTGNLNSMQTNITGQFNALSQSLSSMSTNLLNAISQVGNAVNQLWNKFNKFLDWIKFDRILNILVLVSTIHNGYMLSRNLGETLISMINNVATAAGNALGLRDVEDQPIDIGPIIGSTIENIIKGLVGAQTLDGIKTGWKKYSAILNAAAMLMYTVQSLNQSIISALEIVGSNVAKIGNALKKWGEVSERAFGWMNISPNFNNPFFSLVERAEDRVSQLDMVAMETISAQEQVKQVGEMTEALQKSISEVEGGKLGKESPEATKVKAKEDASKSASQSSAEIPYGRE